MENIKLVATEGEFLQREDKMECLGIDRYYEWRMQDYKWLNKKLTYIKKKCKPGAKLGAYEVVEAYTHHCILKNKQGKKVDVTYIVLAQTMTIKKKINKPSDKVHSQKLHSL